MGSATPGLCTKGRAQAGVTKPISSVPPWLPSVEDCNLEDEVTVPSPTCPGHGICHSKRGQLEQRVK